MVEAAAEMHPAIPVCLHQDHGNDEATCLSAIQHGFTSVMMDGSLEADGKTPATYDYNVAITAPGRRDGARGRRLGRGRARRASARSRPASGEAEDGHGAEGAPRRATSS